MSRLRRCFEDAAASSHVPFALPRNQRVQDQIDRLRWIMFFGVWLGALSCAAIVLVAAWRVA